jgi:lysophospholipase L1-like esterase
VEVINAGIPHFTTDHIVAALEEELLGYGPDVLTVYTGCNDAVRPLAETAVQKVCRSLDVYSAGYATLRKVTNALLGQALFGQWTPYLSRMEAEAIQRQLDLHVEKTRTNMERVVAIAEEHGIPLVIVRQPITTWFDRESRGLVAGDAPRTTYEAEFEELAATLEREGALPGFEVTLYVHHHLLDVMDELAAAHGLPVVDNVALVAQHPEGLGSKVHLTAEANLRLAEALAEVIRPLLAGGAR